MQNILVTGATGFVGRPLCAKLLGSGARVSAAVWAKDPLVPALETIEPILIDSIGPDTDWAGAFVGIDTVIHLAARVHVMDDRVEDPLIAYRSVNVAGTEILARAAASSGVKRFIFLSSVKVNGEESEKKYTARDVPAPSDPYAVSKLEAEIVLRKISDETGLEIVIIRPPLVYGPGVKANFHSLLKIISTGLPLPFATVRNERSLIYLENLIDSIILCANHPAAAGRTYLVRDGEDVSTPELIYKVADALGKTPHLFQFPLAALRLGGRLTGKSAAVNRLLGSLVVDDSEIRTELGWKPPFTMAEGLTKTADWYKTL